MTQHHRQPPSRIALTGYARAGKDEVGKILQDFGYERRTPGDIIKRQVCDLVEEELGFSAFTEIPEQKEKIRPLLEHWGEVNYDNIQNEFFASLPARCVNTRLVRWPEAKRWQDEGGKLYVVLRTGKAPATAWENAQYEELLRHVQINGVIRNDGTIADLRETVITTFCL